MRPPSKSASKPPFKSCCATVYKRRKTMRKSHMIKYGFKGWVFAAGLVCVLAAVLLSDRAHPLVTAVPLAAGAACLLSREGVAE